MLHFHLAHAFHPDGHPRSLDCVRVHKSWLVDRPLANGCNVPETAKPRRQAEVMSISD